MRLLLALCILAPSISFAWEENEKTLTGLDTEVRNVWSGGAWKSGDLEGYYRFVVVGGGYEHYKTKLYVQWIKHGSDMKEPLVVKTTEVMELSEPPVYSFYLPSCAGGWECGMVIIEATHTYELTKHKFKITFKGIGRYEFKNAL